MLRQTSMLSILMMVGFAGLSQAVSPIETNFLRSLVGVQSESDSFRELHEGHRDLQTTTRVTSLSTDPDAPQITNLTQWMTQAKTNAILGAKTITQLSLPGVNRAGLNFINNNQTLLKTQLTAMGFNSSDQNQFGRLIQEIYHEVLVGNPQPLPGALRLGARYIDLRVAGDPKNATKLFLSNSHLSSIPLEQCLKEINVFLLENPSEILIVDINHDYNSLGNAGQQASTAAIANYVKLYVNATFILPISKLSAPISSYGGAFFTGFDFNSSFTNAVIKHSVNATAADSPIAVVNNLQTFLSSGYSTYQPTTYDFIKSDPYITSTFTTITSTLRNITGLANQIESCKQKPRGETRDNENKRNKLRENLEKRYSTIRDVLVSDQVVPAFRVGSAQLSNVLFLDMVRRVSAVQNQVRIVSIDDFNVRNSLEIIQLNILRFL
ncbi:pi-plc x domain-containing protein 3 [Stylonychia lemnae]|uniref:Pi-plc x domain-containing protein 3 n=1 Tax=Stylonychia lemnae TaxID=5949 RepID=A0A077ZSA1_STYLE|nr:pi-plc x domain-containing protein 3 [Stylonychia lemnae]|eukprot:CDW72399.1 pi-plc x domain-containing protein 3 [Stylonychia lemnae]